MTRKVDPLGRVTLPMEQRDVLEIEAKDTLEVYVDDD